MKPKTKKFRLTGKIWLHDGHGAWHFITISKQTSKEIKKFVGRGGSAWGSCRVTVMVPGLSWETSIFSDTKRGAYLLPIKAQVRKKLGVGKGDSLNGKLSITVETGFLV